MGLKGPTGPEGVTGDKGIIGPQGALGTVGEQGAHVPGQKAKKERKGTRTKRR